MTTELPIEKYLDSIKSELAQSPQLILQAEPGAGKSTRVPLSLLDAEFLKHQKIIMLEPRRLAARSIARFLASQLEESVGQTIGYRVKGDSRSSKKTRLEIVTEGVLLRQLQYDPELTDVGLIIFDEFHERSVQNDLAFSLSLYVQEVLREDLKLLVMSATLDGNSLQSQLNDAPIIQCEGQTFPVSVNYQQRPDKWSLIPELVKTIQRALFEQVGDLLVFLPGVGEIQWLAQGLRDIQLPENVAVHTLFGALSGKEQDSAIQPSKSHRKIVLATNIAETSLTIEGISVVIDSGLQRTAKFNARSGMTQLVTEHISAASAQQRKGRAGRLSAGVCYRLWSQSQNELLSEFATEEILIADLAPLVLELAGWNIREIDELHWITAPPKAHFNQAKMLLQQLGLLDGTSNITEQGKKALSWPLHPRLAHMMDQAEQWQQLPLAANIAALLSEKDIFESGKNASLVDRLSALFANSQANNRAQRSSFPVKNHQLQGVLKESNRLLSLKQATDKSAINEQDVLQYSGRLLAQAYPDRIAKSREGSDNKFLLRNGKGAVLNQSQLSHAEAFIVAAELDGNLQESRIYRFAYLSEALFLQDFSNQISQQNKVYWDIKKQRLIAESIQFFGAIVLSRRPIENWSQAEKNQLTSQAILEAIVESELKILPWNSRNSAWLKRVRWLAAFNNEWPALTNNFLKSDIQNWLAPFLTGISHPSEIDLSTALKNLLTWDQQQELEIQAPVKFLLPTGQYCPIEYPEHQNPVISVILQSMFGVEETPRLAWGRVPLTVELLSPARRPIQITSDLKGFWQTSYKDVCKDMKGKYPKHRWPEKPEAELPGKSIKPKK